MRDKVNFIYFTPALWNTLGETVDLASLAVHLTKVSWLIKLLMLLMFALIVTISIDCTNKIWTVVSDTTIMLEVNDADYLLVQLASSIVKTVKRAHVSLKYLMFPSNIRIRKIRPVISLQRCFIWCPACKAVNEDNWIVVGPLRPR